MSFIRIGVSLIACALAFGSSTPAAPDPVRDAQWHLDALHIDEAHKVTKGADVIVAIIDTGVDATHPDLVGSIVDGTDLTHDGPGNGTTDMSGHGTGMTGLIAAHGHALGIAPEAKVLAVRTATLDTGFGEGTHE